MGSATRNVPSSSPSSAAATASRQAPLVCGETWSRASQAASIVAARSASVMASSGTAETAPATCGAGTPESTEARLSAINLGEQFGEERALDVAARLDERDPLAGEARAFLQRRGERRGGSALGEV